MADFFTRKINTLFTRFDMDGNGKIEEDDFDKWSETLVGFGNLSVESANHLRQNMKQIWRVYFLPADADNDGSVVLDELLIYMKTALADDHKRAAISATLPIIFDAIDVDHDGGISNKEFANYFRSLGLKDDSFADQVFAAMDSNNDGALSNEGLNLKSSFYFNLN